MTLMGFGYTYIYMDIQYESVIPIVGHVILLMGQKNEFHKQ